MAQKGPVLVLVLVAFLGTTTAFLATPLNASDPDVAYILCPDQTVGETRDHKWITREAIRRNLRQFFLDNPPSSKPDFNVPSTATLTQLYSAYYGASASPARFIKAVNSIAASNVNADSATQLRHDPNIQGDAEELPELQKTLSKRYPQILTSIMVDEAYTAARSLLGLSLHSIQKFYSHSTWIELGHTDILSDLGLPGYAFDDVAGPLEDVCTPCSTPQECTGNVVAGASLSSGYYQYDDPTADSYLIPKPSTGGKCSHGGVLDLSIEEAPQGGVNKDTASPCFSPHYYLHDQAAELAVQATDHYLTVLLDAIGNEKYRRLFDLYRGSALSIAIDTTGSMTDDIDAVKAQVKSIVENTSPELYILAPFNDPTYGPGLRTDNATEFLEAVNSLRASGGISPLEELFWSGLQLALSLTPDYGDIFCFTDAGGRDGEKMESCVARSQQQHNKVSVIYSGTIPSASQRMVLTEIEEYQRLADATGGLFIPSEKFSIDAIMPILSEGVQSASVDITQLKDLLGPVDTEVPIDNSISDFEIRIVGTITDALLTDFTGTEYDLTDEASLQSDPTIEVIIYTDGLKAVRWLEPRYGVWSLHTDSASSYSISVSANSTLSFLGWFSILDPSPPHPHYRAAEGNPLINTVYYIGVTLIGYLESYVTDVTYVEYVDKSGLKLREIPYNGIVDDEFYIRSDPLPDEPFYIKLYGYVQSGNVFSRLMTVLMTPVETGVGVLATSEDLSARPGETAQGDFIVFNYGLSSYFALTGTDDKDFLDKVTPDRVYISHNDSAVVTVSFVVPSSAVPGTVSMVTLTAQSEEQTQSVNSAISQFVVLPSVSDDSPPSCELTSEPDCSGYELNGVCTEKTWTVQATLRDSVSGLVNVYARPEGLSSSVDGLNPGTTGNVVITYSASCCTPQVDIIGVDSSGNVGKCVIDMGALGGMIIDLEALSVGQTWVYLTWTLTPTDYEVHKYSILINDDFTQDSRCKDSVCYTNVTELDPCSLQTFKVTPYFTVGGSDHMGEPAYTDAYTTDDVPGTPEDGVVVSTGTNTATISWTALNSRCIGQYQVCYKAVDYPDPRVCEQTSATSYDMLGLEACTHYEVNVTSLSPTGLTSTSSLIFAVDTILAPPGLPRNVQTALSLPDAITVTWDNPLENAHCIQKFAVSITVKVTTALTGLLMEHQHEVHMVAADSDNTFTIYNLVPCTNYTIEVVAISWDDSLGPAVKSDSATAETNPDPVWEVATKEVTTVSMEVTWEAAITCVDHFKICYYNEEEVTEKCEVVTEPSATLTDLLPCVDYFVSVTAASFSDYYSTAIWQTRRTLDVAPGTPENLTVTSKTAHRIDINFDPSSDNPQCVAEYVNSIVELDDVSKATEFLFYQQRGYTFDNLDACTHYEIKVCARSSELLASSWAVVDATTDEDVPSEPQSFVVRDATTTSLTVAWWTPENNSRCATSFELEWTNPSGETNSETITPAPGTPLPFVEEKEISNLDPCTEYTFKVWTTTASGSVGPSTVLTASTEC